MPDPVPVGAPAAEQSARQPVALVPGPVQEGAPVPDPPAPDPPIRQPVGAPAAEPPVRQPVALVPGPVPDAVAGDPEETFDPGPPVDAILDTPYDAETFDDCAYNTEEEHPWHEEAC